MTEVQCSDCVDGWIVTPRHGSYTNPSNVTVCDACGGSGWVESDGDDGWVAEDERMERTDAQRNAGER